MLRNDNDIVPIINIGFAKWENNIIFSALYLFIIFLSYNSLIYFALLGKPEKILIININTDGELILKILFINLILDLEIISIIPKSINILEKTNIGNRAGNKLLFHMLKDVKTLAIIELELVNISKIKINIRIIYI